MTCQPLKVILWYLPEKGRKRKEDSVEQRKVEHRKLEKCVHRTQMPPRSSLSSDPFLSGWGHNSVGLDE